MSECIIDSQQGRIAFSSELREGRRDWVASQNEYADNYSLDITDEIIRLLHINLINLHVQHR